MICRSINAPASSIERGFVSFPRRGFQYLWRNTWHKTNLVNVALGREIPRNTPLSQKMNYSSYNGKAHRRERPGQNPHIWSAFVCSSGHNQMLEMKKNRAMLFMLFHTHTLPVSNYFQASWPIHGLRTVSNSQWFCPPWMCKRVTATMSFGSELCWSTTHFVKPFNALEHPCPPLKFFFLPYKSIQKWKVQNVSAFKVNLDILCVVLNAFPGNY